MSDTSAKLAADIAEIEEGISILCKQVPIDQERIDWLTRKLVKPSLAPDGTPCESDTSGLLQRAHIIAGKSRYIGKETDRKWEEGDDISVQEFKTTEYGRAKKVVADTAIADRIRAIGIRKTLKLTKMSQHTIEKIARPCFDRDSLRGSAFGMPTSRSFAAPAPAPARVFSHQVLSSTWQSPVAC
ncbi:MAG: hypothetical protein ABR881_19245 [Candidatus Sulfotelmatobacter sp.]|jgi:hypothetical protein